MKRTQSLLSTVAVLAMSTFAIADDELPEYTADGLKLVNDTEVAALYMLEGASVAGYDKVKLVECFVAFRKNWDRDYNRNAAGFTERVGPNDMERIRNAVSAEFNNVFTEVLTEGGYEVTEDIGETVLMLRPAIIDLDIIAPDLLSGGSVRKLSAYGGSMTLYMELYDSATNQKIAMVMDSQRSHDDGRITYTTRIDNKREADRMLRRWATLLVEGLNQARKEAEG